MKTNRCNPRPALAAGMALLLAAFVPNTGASEVGGAITTNTTWATTDSPILVTSNLEVAADTTLTVESGVLVQFAADRFLTIRGHLVVEGTAENPVVFTDFRDDEPGGDLNGDGDATHPEPGGWGGLSFLAGASGDLRHAEIRYAGYLGEWFALWHQGGGALRLDHCTVRDSAGVGAWLRNSTGGVTIRSCNFANNTMHGLYLDGTPATLEENAFSNNGTGLLVANVAVPLSATASSFTGNSLAGAAAIHSSPVDARGSWWGHASGPQHPANTAGLGDPVGDGILFDPWDDGIAHGTVTLTASPPAGGSLSGGGTFPIGSDVIVSADAADGHTFDGWFEGDTGVASDMEYSFTLTQDRHLTARFSPITAGFTIIASAGEGGFIEPSGTMTVAQGGNQFFVIYPENGYDLDDLIIDGVAHGPSTYHHFENIQAHHTIHATFRPVLATTYTVTVSANDTTLGSVTGAGTFASGSEVSVSATPAETAEFVNWTESGTEVSTTAGFSFVLTRDRVLVANFAALPDTRSFTVSYAAGPDLNIPRNAPVQRAITDSAGRPLVICGTTTNYVSQGNCEVYDPATNTFTTRAMNSIRGSSPAVVQLADGRHLIAGGDSNLGVPASNTAEIFDPVTNTFTPTGSMSQVRASASAILLNDGHALVVGAWYRGYANTAEIYHPDTGTFSQPASTMSEPRTRPALLPRADGKVLVLGGYAPYSGAPLQSLDVFDPATNSFSPLSTGIPLPDDGVNFSTRQDYVTPLGDGTFLVMGHAVAGSVWQPRAMIYNPQSGTFTPTAEQPPTGFYAGPQWLPQLGIAVCTTYLSGEFGILIYDPRDGGFHTPAETRTLPENHTMGGNSAVAVLPDGRLLVAGGTQRTGSQFNFGALADTLLVAIEAVEPPPTPQGKWVRQISGTDAHLQKVFFIDDQTGWAGGADWTTRTPVLLKTTNGGASWQPLNPGPGTSVAAMRFFDANHGWILVNTYGHIDSEVRLLQTSDGGLTWTSRFSAENISLSCLHFLDPQHGWAAGSTILRTSDGGLTWTDQPLPEDWHVNDLLFTNAHNGWAAGSDWEHYQGLILKTTNGGVTWTPQTIHDTENMGHVHQLWFHDAGEAVALGGHGEMLATTNGGADWDPAPGMPIGFPEKIVFASRNNAWMVGSWMGADLGPPHPQDHNYSIMGSTDGGVTWTPDSGDSTRDKWLSDVHFPTPAHGWAVGEDGTILKYTGGMPTAPGYDDWALRNFTPDEFAAGLHLPDADPGGHGIQNLIRYALDLGARAPRHDGLPQPHPGTAGFAMSISLPHPLPHDAEFTLGASATLDHWIEYPIDQWIIDHEQLIDDRRHLLARPPAIPGDGRSLFLKLIIRLKTP